MNIKKTISAFLALTAAAALLTGCGASDSTAATAAKPAQPEVAAADVVQGPITITADDMMKFSLKEFDVKAGSEVTIVFKNIGKMPKEAMGHNLVVLVKGTNPLAFAAASIRFPNDDFVSPELKDSVVAFTKVLGPGESQTLTFTAPSEAGDYPFICSFPAHTPAGMRGVMKVK